MSISDQVSDASIPAKITTPVVISLPDHAIEIDGFGTIGIVSWDDQLNPSYDEQNVNDQWFIQADRLTITETPEPSTWALTLAGFVGLAFVSYSARPSGRAGAWRLRPTQRGADSTPRSAPTR